MYLASHAGLNLPKPPPLGIVRPSHRTAIMNKKSYALAAVALMTIGVACYLLMTGTQSRLDAAVQELRQSAAGSPQREAARQKLTAFGPAAHDALFGVLKAD